MLCDTQSAVFPEKSQFAKSNLLWGDEHFWKIWTKSSKEGHGRGYLWEGSVTTGMFSTCKFQLFVVGWSARVGSGRKPWTCYVDGLETLLCLHAHCLGAGSPGSCPWGQSWLQGVAPGSL